jgi:hypothetical protein
MMVKIRLIMVKAWAYVLFGRVRYTAQDLGGHSSAQLRCTINYTVALVRVLAGPRALAPICWVGEGTKVTHHLSSVRYEHTLHHLPQVRGHTLS